MPDISTTGFMQYRQYTDIATGQQKYTRMATADMTWVIKKTNLITYKIQFDKNFSKKHLFTFSKKAERNAKDIADLMMSGLDFDEAWEKVEFGYLQAKITAVLGHRAIGDICGYCGHPFNKHKPVGRSPAPGSTPACACIEIKSDRSLCGCTTFKSAYQIAREQKGKGDNPLAGARTTKNSCIILGMVPRSEFEDVVIKSIQNAQPHSVQPHRAQPHPGPHRGPQRGRPNPAPPPPTQPQVSDEYVLTWDFGQHRNGAIIIVESTAVGFKFRAYRGCKVMAKKLQTTEVDTEAWQIFHMETGGEIGDMSQPLRDSLMELKLQIPF
jgi:hypothetical protein